MIKRSSAMRRSLAFGLIAFLTAAVHATDLLYNQDNNCSNTYIVSENIASIPYYQSRVADDFFVPAGADWSIEYVVAEGGFFGGGQSATSFDVFFYDDAAGAPGNAIDACSNAGVSYSKLINAFTFPLPTPCLLSGGTVGRTYWTSIQGNVPSSPTTDWGWRERTAQNGNVSHVEYPGGTSGAGCVSWSLKTDCVGTFETATPDQCFSLSGSSPIIFGNGFEGPPTGDCTNLGRINVGDSTFKWLLQSGGTVTFGDNTSASVSFTSYTSVWNENTANPWPGANGLSVRPALVGTVYLAEAFAVPFNGSVNGTVTWANKTTGAGYNAANNAASYTISKCAGDFGQFGTQLGADCAADIASATGLTSIVSGIPQAGVCALVPGETYYFNVLQAPLSGISQTGAAYPSCSSNCAPWTARQ